jgi:hypothetical protein
MLDSSPSWVTLTVLLHSHRSCAVHWEVKRTGILTGGKACKLEQVQSMLMPGSKVEAAEEGACVQTFCTQLTGLEILNFRSSTLGTAWRVLF